MSKKNKSHLIRVGLVGASGKMGSEIQKLAAECGCEIVAALRTARDWKSLSANAVYIVVDFSPAEGLNQALDWCAANSRPLVSGSTGLDKKDFNRIQAVAKKIPLLYSGNMSLGIAVLSSMLKSFTAIRDWDFQIEEVHHSKKKDKPSGTALLLQKGLTKALGRELPEAQSIRGGGVPGIHTVWAMGQEEVLLVQHTAFNRQVFARGALRAASWLFDKGKPGLYDLSDLYKVNSKEP